MLISLSVALAIATYLPIALGVPLYGIAIQLTLFYCSIPIWIYVARERRPRRALSVKIVLTVIAFFMVVRVIQVLWIRFGIYMLEKTWGFLMLLTVCYLYGVDLRSNFFRGDELIDKLGGKALALYLAIFSIPSAALVLSGIRIDVVELSIAIPYFVANSFFEELLFRGLMLRSLVDRLPVLDAIAIESIAFGLWHLPHHVTTILYTPIPALLHVCYATFFAIPASVMTLITRSLSFSIALHTYVNTVATMGRADVALITITGSLALSTALAILRKKIGSLLPYKAFPTAEE